MSESDCRALVLGIGNVLMGDEGVGVEIVRELSRRDLPRGVTCLDGGTGSFQLLGPLGRAERVFLVDATDDGRPAGTLARLRPRFSRDYPRRLTAHDIGLKDLLDAFYLIGEAPRVTLFAVSIDFPQPLRVGLSWELRACVPGIADEIQRVLLRELETDRTERPIPAAEPRSAQAGRP
ncbi:MAG: hydrogenase maturation protease [Planctomycetota bacterium]|jgi:hydrogenase maturation protease